MRRLLDTRRELKILFLCLLPCLITLILLIPYTLLGNSPQWDFAGIIGIWGVTLWGVQAFVKTAWRAIR